MFSFHATRGFVLVGLQNNNWIYIGSLPQINRASAFVSQKKLFLARAGALWNYCNNITIFMSWRKIIDNIYITSKKPDYTVKQHTLVYTYRTIALNTDDKQFFHQTDYHNGLTLHTVFIARRCVSAVFAVARCLSVCLSVTLVDIIHTAEDIVKLLAQPGSPIILVCWLSVQIPNSKGNPP